jgi:hypothetical protein
MHRLLQIRIGKLLTIGNQEDRHSCLSASLARRTGRNVCPPGIEHVTVIDSSALRNCGSQ